MDYLALKNEIQTDPHGYGYAGKSEMEIADILNQVRSEIQIERDEELPTWNILEATDKAELDALGAADRETYKAILSMGTINVKGTNVRSMLAGMFGTGTTTRANLLALQTRPGSRAEELGFGRAHHLDVAQALRS